MLSPSTPTNITPTTLPTHTVVTPETLSEPLRSKAVAQVIYVSRLEAIFSSLTNQVQRTLAHQAAAMHAVDTDHTGLVVMSSVSSSFQEQQRKTTKLLDRCRVIVHKLQTQCDDISNNPNPLDHDLLDRVPLYHLQLSTLTQCFHDQFNEMKKLDDELTLYLEDDAYYDYYHDDCDEDDNINFYSDCIHHVHDDDSSGNESSSTSAKVEAADSTLNSSEQSWSSVDEPLPEFDALMFTID